MSETLYRYEEHSFTPEQDNFIRDLVTDCSPDLTWKKISLKLSQWIGKDITAQQVYDRYRNRIAETLTLHKQMQIQRTLSTPNSNQQYEEMILKLAQKFEGNIRLIIDEMRQITQKGFGQVRNIIKGYIVKSIIFWLDIINESKNKQKLINPFPNPCRQNQIDRIYSILASRKTQQQLTVLKFKLKCFQAMKIMFLQKSSNDMQQLTQESVIQACNILMSLKAEFFAGSEEANDNFDTNTMHSRQYLKGQSNFKFSMNQQVKFSDLATQIMDIDEMDTENVKGDTSKWKKQQQTKLLEQYCRVGPNYEKLSAIMKKSINPTIRNMMSSFDWNMMVDKMSPKMVRIQIENMLLTGLKILKEMASDPTMIQLQVLRTLQINLPLVINGILSKQQSVRLLLEFKFDKSLQTPNDQKQAHSHEKMSKQFQIRVKIMKLNINKILGHNTFFYLAKFLKTFAQEQLRLRIQPLTQTTQPQQHIINGQNSDMKRQIMQRLRNLYTTPNEQSKINF